MVAVSALLLIKCLSSQVDHLFPLTSKLKKARFEEGFMDEKENTMIQGLQSQIENWGWMLIKYCSKNWTEWIFPCQGGDERKQTRRKVYMVLTCFIPQTHKIVLWLPGSCLKQLHRGAPIREHQNWVLCKHSSSSQFLLLTFRTGWGFHCVLSDVAF